MAFDQNEITSLISDHTGRRDGNPAMIAREESEADEQVRRGLERLRPFSDK
jgi:hypothetical protein